MTAGEGGQEQEEEREESKKKRKMAEVESARTSTGTVITIPFGCEVEEEDVNRPIVVLGRWRSRVSGVSGGGVRVM